MEQSQKPWMMALISTLGPKQANNTTRYIKDYTYRRTEDKHYVILNLLDGKTEKIEFAPYQSEPKKDQARKGWTATYVRIILQDVGKIEELPLKLNTLARLSQPDTLGQPQSSGSGLKLQR